MKNSDAHLPLMWQGHQPINSLSELLVGAPATEVAAVKEHISNWHRGSARMRIRDAHKTCP